jgi:hypothetical protein
MDGQSCSTCQIRQPQALQDDAREEIVGMGVGHTIKNCVGAQVGYTVVAIDEEERGMP